MKRLPTARHQRRLTAPLLALTASAALVAGLSAPSVADDKDDLKRQQKQVEKRIEDAKDDVASSAKEFQHAAATVELANQRLVRAQRKLTQTQGQLAVARARDAQLKRELAEAQRKLREAEAKVRAQERKLRGAERVIEQFAVEQLMSGDRGLQAFSSIVNGENPMTVAEELALSASIGDAQVSQAQRLAASRVMVEVERQKTEVLRDAIAKKKAEAEQNVKVMSSLVAQAAEEQLSVAAHTKRAEKAKRDARSALDADRAVQAQLERDNSELKARIQKIIDAELKKAGKGGGGGSSTGDSGSTLSRPAPGIVTSPYGWRTHPILGYRRMHDGTDFRAPCGSGIYAAASGTIVSQYYAGGYGNRVVVNHGIKRGVSVMTTYNHLTAFARSTGSSVKRGQLIAYAGTTGMSTGCHLHFQVLVNGNHTNPMNWF